MLNDLLEDVRAALWSVWDRRWLALGVAWGVSLLGWLAVALIPNAYESQARIFVQLDDVLAQQIGIGAGSRAKDIDRVRQTLTSAVNMERVVRTTRIGDTVTTPAQMESAVAALARDVKVVAQGENLFEITVRSGRGDLSDSENAQLAQVVTQRVIDIFREENLGGARGEMRETIEFLDLQLAERQRELEDAEQRRLNFEAANPELIGEELVPALQMITADMTIALTHASGVPAIVEGVFIDTPAGLFEVAEECSGVKFLIAMIALGTLVAHACFRSWRRRAAFMAVAIVLPILANGVRAWGTTYIAQSQGVEFAAGFDHIFYGWFFFALVMALLLAGAWRFFDRPVGDDFVRLDRLNSWRVIDRLERHRMGGGAGLAAMAAAVALFLTWSEIARAAEAELPAEIALPQVPGWERIDYAPDVWWEPRAAGAGHRLLGRYRDGEGREVDVFYALYAAQDEGREAGSFGEGALVPDTPWRWLSPAGALAGGKGDWLQANGHVKRLAITWYRTGDTLTGSNLTLKRANILDRLVLGEQPTAMLILSAEDSESNAPADAVASFLSAAGPLAGWMDRIAQLP